MKNLKKLMGLMVAGVLALGFNTNVRAETIDFEADKIEGLKGFDYLGENSPAKFNVRYDDQMNVSVLDITTSNLNDAAIQAILNHAPGNSGSPAVLGTLYFGIETGITGTQFKKYGEPFVGNNFMSLAKSAAESAVAEDNPTNNNLVWVPQIKVDYFDKVQNKFVTLSGSTTGGKTVKEAIEEKFKDEEKSFDELVYGKDYVFYGYEDRSYVSIIQSDSDEYTDKYYFLVNISTSFPVESENVETGDGKGNFNKEGYFPSLETALAASNYSKNIKINDNIEITKDLEIPAGVTVDATNGKLTIKSGAKLTVKGTVKADTENIVLENGGEVEVEGSGSLQNNSGAKLHFVNVSSTLENGIITVSPKLAKLGDTVTITVTPNEGYELKEGSLKVTKKAVASAISTIALPIAEDNEIPITGYTFPMPDGEVEVTAEFEKIEEQIKITLDIDGDVKENYEVTKGWTLQDLLNDLKNKGYSITGFTNKDGEELELSSEITEGMYLVAVLEDEVVTEAPQTLDNILKFVGIGVLGLGTLGVAAKKYLC